MAGQCEAADVAACIIETANNMGSGINNLRLQKTLFFCQSECLGKTGRVLFPDRIVAWQYGPVVEGVYYAYSYRGASDIRKPASMVIDIMTGERRPTRRLDGDDLSLVERVVGKWKDKSVWDLVNETHRKGGAWDRVYNRGNVNGSGYGQEIPISIIAECYV